MNRSASKYGCRLTKIISYFIFREIRKRGSVRLIGEGDYLERPKNFRVRTIEPSTPHSSSKRQSSANTPRLPLCFTLQMNKISVHLMANVAFHALYEMRDCLLAPPSPPPGLWCHAWELLAAFGVVSSLFSLAKTRFIMRNHHYSFELGWCRKFTANYSSAASKSQNPPAPLIHWN